MKENLTLKFKIQNSMHLLKKIFKKELALWSSPQAEVNQLVLVGIRKKIKNTYTRNHYPVMHYNVLRNK